MTGDPNVERLRGELAQQDDAILAAVNARLLLVAELKRYKEEAGLPFVDPEQEQRLLERLAEQNSGPLSEDGVRRLFTEILALAKRELDS